LWHSTMLHIEVGSEFQSLAKFPLDLVQHHHGVKQVTGAGREGGRFFLQVHRLDAVSSGRHHCRQVSAYLYTKTRAHTHTLSGVVSVTAELSPLAHTLCTCNLSGATPRLVDAGFVRLSEGTNWTDKIKPGTKAFYDRNGSTLVAFVVGERYVRITTQNWVPPPSFRPEECCGGSPLCRACSGQVHDGPISVA
jgi:hypothetical protein